MEKNKLKLLRVLDIIKETDEMHPITARQIVEKLKLYGIETERKSVLRDIATLTEYGYDILPCEDNKRGVYLASRDFEDWELKVLTDAVLSAKFLTDSNTQGLLEKISSFASADSRKTLKCVTPVSSTIKIGDPTTKNHIDVILKAVRLKKKVAFRYTYTGDDMEKHYKYEGHMYPVSPYSLIWRQDKYYLIGNYGSYKTLSYYRLDRIRELEIIDEPIMPLEELLGSNAELRLKEFVEKNIYNYGGKQIHLVLRVKASMIDTLIDTFGPDIHIFNEPEDYIRATVTASDGRGIIYWLLQYGENVEVIEPASIREEIKTKLETICKKYGVL